MILACLHLLHTAYQQVIQAPMSIFATSKEVRTLAGIINGLLDDVTALKRASRSQALEFTELYDKVRHQMSRMAKRDAHRVKADPEFREDLPVSEPLNGVDAISAKIIARRARGANLE